MGQAHQAFAGGGASPSPGPCLCFFSSFPGQEASAHGRPIASTEAEATPCEHFSEPPDHGLTQFYRHLDISIYTHIIHRYLGHAMQDFNCSLAGLGVVLCTHRWRARVCHDITVLKHDTFVFECSGGELMPIGGCVMYIHKCWARAVASG
jgi:hypothetical protein